MTTTNGLLKQKILVGSLPVSAGVTVRYIINRTISVIKSGETLSCTFVNPGCEITSTRYSDYSDLLHKFDFVLPDGVGVVVAAKWLGRPKLYRASFDMTSVARPLFDAAAQLGACVAIIGGKDGVANKASEIVSESYPGLHVGYHHSGFFKKTNEVVEGIKQSGAEIVIVGMGAPYQERFSYTLARSNWKGSVFTCGGFLDQLIESDSENNFYPKYVDSLNLRFLYRLYKDPLRLWRRYLLHYPLFLYRVIIQKLSGG